MLVFSFWERSFETSTGALTLEPDGDFRLGQIPILLLRY